jgi:hypothetical protein
MSLSEFQVPTDNLYKFLALSGLAGFFLLPVYLSNEITERNHQFIEVETEIRILSVEFENLQDEALSIIYQTKT